MCERVGESGGTLLATYPTQQTGYVANSVPHSHTPYTATYPACWVISPVHLIRVAGW